MRLVLALFLVAAGCANDMAAAGDAAGTGDAAVADAAAPDAAVVDLAPAPDLVPEGPACGKGFCQHGQVCVYGTCMDPPPACTSDGDCGNDTWCDPAGCIPYPLGPRGPDNMACSRPVVIGLFQPASKCKWTGSTASPPAYPMHRNVLSTPLVVDFDFDDDPTTVKPSIVFNSYNCTDGGCGGDGTQCFGVIRVIDGDTCQDQFTLTASAPLIGDTTPAVGDLDGDGRPDIVAERNGGGVVGWRYDDKKKTFVEMWPFLYSTFDAGQCHWDGLSLHDLDDDGVPEIVQATPFPAVYNAMGQLVDGFGGFATQYIDGLFPVMADLDGDGNVEFPTGAETFRFDRATKKWTVPWTSSGKLSRGFTAIADFGTFSETDPSKDAPLVLDGVPEVVVVSQGTVRVQTQGGRVVFGPVACPGGGNGGPPTVADFDGDGRPEIGVAAAVDYAVYDLDCVGQNVDPKRCVSSATTGILWSKASQDKSSNVTGSSVFDFDGDGIAEVVYADECFSRVYEGPTGDVLYSQPHTSCTWYENPVVADVNGDFKSEIVIPSNSNCNVACPSLDPVFDGLRCKTDMDCPSATHCAMENVGDPVGRCRCTTSTDCGSPTLACVDPIAGPSQKGKVCRTTHPQGIAMQGIEVIHDVLDRWVGSRPIWNQHAYSVTNVDDKGIIPKTSSWMANWKIKGLNNYRTNVQGTLKPLAVPDVTTKLGGPFMCDASTQTLHLDAEVCNRGTAPIAAGVPVTFYRGAPSVGQIVCQTTTMQVLQPGTCEDVKCDYPNAPTSSFELSVQGDDTGGGKGLTTECDEMNNWSSENGVYCNIVG